MFICEVCPHNTVDAQASRVVIEEGKTDVSFGFTVVVCGPPSGGC